MKKTAEIKKLDSMPSFEDIVLIPRIKLAITENRTFDGWRSILERFSERESTQKFLLYQIRVMAAKGKLEIRKIREIAKKYDEGQEKLREWNDKIRGAVE